MNDNQAPSERTRVKRLPKRGAYDRETIHRILDEGLVAHVGLVVDGNPVVTPMTYARDGERLLFHGSTASRTMRTLASGAEACVAVTQVDALVLARSAFHHSMNYRSVVVFGKARAITDPEEKLAAFRRFFDRLIPGRWKDVRSPNQVEMNQTLMVEIPIDEASAKARTGGPIDEDDDYALQVWAGLIPFSFTPDEPVPDETLPDDVEMPEYVRSYTRRKN